MVNQNGGGSIGQSLRYMDTAAPEQTAASGSDLLLQRGLVVRPAIGGGTRKKRSLVPTASRAIAQKTYSLVGRGGFMPSVMKGIVDGGMFVGPLAVFTARKMLYGKSRSGGGKRAQLQAEKEEARAMLEAYGKPTAKNVKAYVAARHEGNSAATAFVEAFQAKKATKKVRKAKAKKANVASVNSAKSNGSAKSNRSARSANTVAVVNKANTKKRKSVSAVSTASPASKKYFEELKKARETLSEVGYPTGQNMSRFASMKLKGENTAAWLENFKARRPITLKTAKKARKPKAPSVVVNNKPKTPVMNKPKTPESNKPKTPVLVVNNKPKTPESNKPVKTKKVKKAKKVKVSGAAPKPHSTASKKYFEELIKARETLSEIGYPAGPNMSKFASMKLKGENTAAWLENFKKRRPLSMKTAKKARKPKAAPKKVLSAVNEEIEEELPENNMQGYSENFEPESENSSEK